MRVILRSKASGGAVGEVDDGDLGQSLLRQAQDMLDLLDGLGGKDGLPALRTPEAGNVFDHDDAELASCTVWMVVSGFISPLQKKQLMVQPPFCAW